MNVLKSMGSLWIVFTLVCSAASLTVTVNLGQSVNLSCTREQQENYPENIQWKTADQPVANYSSRTFEAHQAFKGRVRLPEDEKLKKGDFSLIFSSTVYNDFDTYECWYKNEHLNSITLQIRTKSEATYEMLGDSAILPCYRRIYRNIHDSDITLLWKKGNDRVLSITKGNLEKFGNFKERVALTPSEIRKGNISLHISQTHLSDNGTYSCEINSKPTNVTLHLKACHREKTASLHQALLLPLFTDEDVYIDFKSSQNLHNMDNCGESCNSTLWSKGRHGIEIKDVDENHYGTYTVIHRKTNHTICTHVISAPRGSENVNADINVFAWMLYVFIVILVVGFIFCIWSKKDFILNRYNGFLKILVKSCGDQNELKT